MYLKPEILREKSINLLPTLRQLVLLHQLQHRRADLGHSSMAGD
jgi:hypothetical protein